MNDEEIIQLHDDLSEKYLSRVDKYLKLMPILAVCALGLGSLSIGYHNIVGGENINQNVKITLTTGVCLFAYASLLSPILAVYNARKFEKIPKKISKIIKRREQKTSLENL